jgi:ubiquinone/menaquinone biosynthesis C-methylase UbiE
MNYDNMHALKTKLGTYDAGVLLDAAVGRGDFLKFAVKSFRSWKSAAGIDNDPEALEIAAKELNGIPVILILGSVLSMPFINHYFDTVTLSNTIHHIEDLDSLFSEVHRVCKSHGVIIINEMINESHSEMQENYMLYHRFVADIDNQSGRYHHEPFTLKDLLSIIKSSESQMLDYFVHAENTDNTLISIEIEAMSERLNKKIALLRGTDYYYFFENKASDLIARLAKTGIQKPKHVTFVLQSI